jgi:hypothetical protein
MSMVCGVLLVRCCRGSRIVKKIADHPFLREQTFRESLDPDKSERLGRYEAHFDREPERMLAVLLA